MTALRSSPMSDILAATGKAGMQAGAGERFWTKRRLVLAVGYVLVFVVGLDILFAADPTGLVLMAASVAGVLFLHRTWLGVVVWTYVLASGVVAVTAGDDTGIWGIGAGIGFGLVALPIWKRRAPAPAPAYRWQQSAFIPPLPQPVTAPQTPTPAPAPTPEVIVPAAASHPAFAPSVRTIGRIQVVTEAGDLSSELLRKPVLGFLWLYLLARSVWKPGDRITRAALIDEVAHGVKDPRSRLRGYLNDLGDLPQPIGAMVKTKANDELVGFDLGGADADYAELSTLGERIRESSGSLTEDLVARAQVVLSELGSGEFLPGFEEIEKRATKGRGIAGQVVAEVRSQIDTLRADIAVAVGEALLDRGQAAQAVAILDPIVKRSEDRDDVARTLSTALRELGQHDRAADVRRRYAVGQET